MCIEVQLLERIKFDIDSPGFHLHGNGRVTKSKHTYSEKPLQIELGVTPALSACVIRSINPFAYEIASVGSASRLKMTLDPIDGVWPSKRVRAHLEPNTLKAVKGRLLTEILSLISTVSGDKGSIRNALASDMPLTIDSGATTFLLDQEADKVQIDPTRITLNIPRMQPLLVTLWGETSKLRSGNPEIDMKIKIHGSSLCNLLQLKHGEATCQYVTISLGGTAKSPKIDYKSYVYGIFICALYIGHNLMNLYFDYTGLHPRLVSLFCNI